MIDYKSHLLKFVNSLIELPRNPKQCADLITRARALLGRRKNEEIEILDNSITFVIDDFLKRLKQEHGGNYKRYLATELNIHEDFHILKHCLNEYEFSYTDNTPSNVTMCDYFAVYGIRHVAIAHLVVKSPPPQGLSDKESAYFRVEQIQQASDFIFTALECIAYAEQLKTTESLIIQNDALDFENKQLKISQQAEVDKQVKREISKTKSIAAKKAHAKDYESKQIVLTWLSEVISQDTKYIKGSNNRIAGDIFKAGIVETSFDTLAKYVSEYKKELRKAS